MNTLKMSLVIGLAIVLTACGGSDNDDTTKPNITILGSNPTYVLKDHEYKEQGAIATDNVDTNVTVHTSGTVDTSTIAVYTITYTATDKAGNKATATRTVKVADQVKPEIQIIGDNPMSITQGGTYTELGATVRDDIDNNISIDINAYNTVVDTNTVGTYVITYVATDTAGNTTTATRVVNVVDNAKPIITLKGANPLYILQGSAYSDPGATAQDEVDGNITDNINVSGDKSVDTTVGDVNFTITYSVTDNKGNEAEVNRTVAVLDLNITDANSGISYGKIISATTGKIWLDRNLGASRSCQTIDDTLCFGDYYQWGRNTDGHEENTSNTTATRIADLNQLGGEFITGYNDWTEANLDVDGSERVARWSTTDGSSVCPAGFRVATAQELQAETIDADVTNSTNAFDSILKLPASGYRNNSAQMVDVTSATHIWTASAADARKAISYVGTSRFFRQEENMRSYAMPIRCIIN